MTNVKLFSKIISKPDKNTFSKLVKADNRGIMISRCSRGVSA